jgi:hypothetical protein
MGKGATAMGGEVMQAKAKILIEQYLGVKL